MLFALENRLQHMKGYNVSRIGLWQEGTIKFLIFSLSLSSVLSTFLSPHFGGHKSQSEITRSKLANPSLTAVAPVPLSLSLPAKLA